MYFQAVVGSWGLTRTAFLHGEDWESYVYHHEEMFEEIAPDGMQETAKRREGEGTNPVFLFLLSRPS